MVEVTNPSIQTSSSQNPQTTVTIQPSSGGVNLQSLILTPPPPVLLSHDNLQVPPSPSSINSIPPNIPDHYRVFPHRRSAVIVLSRHPSVNTVDDIPQPLQSPLPYATPISQSTNLTVQSLLAIFSVITIIIYICVWRFLKPKQAWIHVIFIFIFVIELCIWERWRAVQRHMPRHRRNHSETRVSLWAPWNDPELQERISARQTRAGDVFDPECPPDYIPPPAYGNLRDSVLVDPVSGRLVTESGSTTRESGTVFETSERGSVLPEYDELSLRSRRSSTMTLRGGESLRESESVGRNASIRSIRSIRRNMSLRSIRSIPRTASLGTVGSDNGEMKDVDVENTVSRAGRVNTDNNTPSNENGSLDIQSSMTLTRPPRVALADGDDDSYDCTNESPHSASSTRPLMRWN